MILFLLAVLVATPLAAADRHGGERTVETEVEDSDARIELKQERGATEDKVVLEFGTDDAELQVKYEFESPDQSVERKLRAQLHQLVEFEDRDGDGAHSLGEPVRSAYALFDDADGASAADCNGAAQGQPLQLRDVESDGARLGKQVVGAALLRSDEESPTSAVDELLSGFVAEDRAVFGFRLTVFGTDVVFQDEPVAPSEAKIDFGVQNYPFTANGTMLALVLETETTTETEFEGGEDEGNGAVGQDEVVNGTAVRLRFSWESEAAVDGERVPVGVTLLAEQTENETEAGETEEKTERLITFAYPRGANIIHDPKAGAAFGLASAGDGATPGPAALLVALCVLGAAYWARHV